MTLRNDNIFRTQKEFEDFCHLPNVLLSSIGCDFISQPRPMWSQILRKCYFLLISLSNFYVFTYITKATFSMITSDEFELSLLLRIISGFNYALCGTVKCLAFIWNMKRYREIFETLNEMFPKTRKEKLTYRVREYFWPKSILTIIYSYLGAVAFIIISPLMESIISYVVNTTKVGWSRAEFRYHKLYEVEYSFDHRSLLPYIVTYAIEIMHAQFVVLFNISADIWLLCFILQLCMHFDYIARALESYEPDKNEGTKDQEFIADVVKKHQIILNLGDDLNRAFGSLLLLSLMSIAATLCCTGVHTLTQDLGRELIEYVAFLPTAVGQYFLVCYYGQLLIIRSQSVAEAAYNNSWYNGSQSYKKSIYIILMRSQKEVMLNAFGFQPICLETFKMVMGATYRVFALLKETML